LSSSSLLDERYYVSAPSGSFSERLLIIARNRIYEDFLKYMRPDTTDTILDVGVSDVLTDGANFLERLYPHPDRITAAGLGEAKEFRKAFPTVNHQQIEPNVPLPFSDKEFDIATSNAVLEHVGSFENQRAFVRELARAAKRVFISVPHRFFPVEHHSGLPFLHWRDDTFRVACKLTGKELWSRQDELILMSRSRLAATVPSGYSPKIGTTGLPLGPFSSNLFLTFEA
jgi:hypothetical protein